jgi:hypothetical protein
MRTHRSVFGKCPAVLTQKNVHQRTRPARGAALPLRRRRGEQLALRLCRDAADYDRWLGVEPDPRELLAPFPAEPMVMWPISKRVNSPQNDDEDLLAEVVLPAA